MKPRTVFLLLLLVALNSRPSYGQQKETLTITTYYPSPTGVYKTIRLWPIDSFNPGDLCSEEGQVFYHQPTHELYTCTGSNPAMLKWSKVGSGSGAAGVQSGHWISPDVCPGTLVGPPIVELSPFTNAIQVCTDVWYTDIKFSPAFSSPPKVFVATEYGVDEQNSPCASVGGGSDLVVAYADNITATGFRLHAASSPSPETFPNTDGCGHSSGQDQDFNFTRARVGWMAIGS